MDDIWKVTLSAWKVKALSIGILII